MRSARSQSCIMDSFGIGQRLDLYAVHGEECGDDEVVQAFWISVFFR